MGNRILYLDGLRGILAIMVFLHHFIYIFCPYMIFGGEYQDFLQTGSWTLYKITALTPVNIIFNPGTAIHFFFLLSGYVQTRRYFVNPEITFLQKSMLKRYFRLAIPVLVVVILVYCCHSFFLIKKNLIPENELTSDWLKSLLPNNLHFMQVIKEGLIDCFRHNSRYYQVLWTMPTELINSFFILGLLLALHNLKHQSIILLAIVIVQFVFLEEYYSIAFVVGALFAKLETSSAKFKNILSHPLVHLLCLIIGLYFGSYPFTGYQDSAIHSVYAPISFFEKYPHVISYLIGVIFLFCFLLYSKTTQNILSKNIFMFFGEISFMFYLIHFLILLSVTPLIYNKLIGPNNNASTLLITCLLSFIAVSIAAYLLTRFIDKPVVNLTNKFAKRFF